MLNPSGPSALATLAALAAATHYWFAGPAIAGALGLSSLGAWLIRAGALALVIYWLVHAMRRPARSRHQDAAEGGSESFRIDEAAPVHRIASPKRA
jgi:hypothetical protein